MSDGAIATYASKVRLVTRVFWEVKEGDVDRSNHWDCKAVDGACGLHCVSSYSLRDGNALRCRQILMLLYCLSTRPLEEVFQ